MSNRTHTVDEHGLTQRARAFADHYMAGDNATEAYLAAGFGAKTRDSASVLASRLLGKVKVAAYIEQRRREKAEAAGWTLEHSICESMKQYEKFQERNPVAAFKYKENLDRLTGLMVERRKVELSLNIDVTRLSDEDLARIAEADSPDIILSTPN